MHRIFVLLALTSACTAGTDSTGAIACRSDLDTTYAPDQATPYGPTAGELTDAWSSVDVAVVWHAPFVDLEPALADGTYAFTTAFTNVYALTGPACEEGVSLRGVPTVTSDDRLSGATGITGVITTSTTSFATLGFDLDVPLSDGEKAAVQAAVEATGHASVVVEDNARFVLVAPASNPSEVRLAVGYTSDLGGSTFTLQTGGYTLTQAPPVSE